MVHHHRASSHFRDLPDDVIILIFSACQTYDLLTLRLTSKRFEQIIARYLSTIAPASARSTFPTCENLFKSLEPSPIYTIRWLRSLVPRHLAAILVDRHRFSHEWSQSRYGIPAEDDYGNSLRARVTNGWLVLRQLSNISREVYELDADLIVKPTKTTRAWKLVHPSRYAFEVFRSREDIIVRERTEYVARLSDGMVQDYKLMFMLLSSVFRTAITNHGEDYEPWVFDWGCGIDGQRLLRRGNSWLTWFILHEGPDLFWQQWWAMDPSSPKTKHFIRDRSISFWMSKARKPREDPIQQSHPDEWIDVNQKWHSIQRDNAYSVQKAVDARIKAMDLGFTAINPIAYFTKYAEIRQSREQSDMPPIVETLSHVPFHVDFRCPEEIFQRFSAMREERAASLPSKPRQEC